ncbi:MAG: hypothetical protein JSV23_03900 [Promethearchaeota archaeon]|nr:MAG: hypothetical protein JSV23_03900 [Candidatus Lokiarchaeota archaeon]
MSRNRDALKFFQAYIKEMIDVGGINLPKSISVSLGAKLGKLLRERGFSGLENSLKKIYNVLNAKTHIKAIDDKTLDITLKYSKKFCPIGGKFNPDKADLIQNTICIPYTASILNSSHPEFKYNPEILDCILSSNNRYCRYRLTKEPKTSIESRE